jgi:hypothetical protein
MTLQVKRPFEVKERYTKIPNAFLRDSEIWAHPGAARAYLLLLSIGPTRTFDNADGLAAYLGFSGRAFRSILSKMRLLGLIEGGQAQGTIVLKSVEELVEEDPFPEFDEPVVEPEPEKLIIAEVEEQPNRKPTGLSQKDRWELIKEAWNKHKPECYLQLDGAVNTPLFIAIETQSKRLGVDRDDYDAFIGAVLRGAGQDDWWSTKDMSATKVFGFGADLDDKKFLNVEKLYQLGTKATRKEKAISIKQEEIAKRNEAEIAMYQAKEEADRAQAAKAKAEAEMIVKAWARLAPEGLNDLGTGWLSVKMIHMNLGVTEDIPTFLERCFSVYTGYATTLSELTTPQLALSKRRVQETTLAELYKLWQATHK